MLYRVTLLRRLGAQLLKKDLIELPPGQLHVLDHVEAGGDKRWPRRFNRVMVLYSDHGVVNSRVRLAQPIFDPEIISADDTTMMISGIELAGANGRLIAEHVQVWKCAQITCTAS